MLLSFFLFVSRPFYFCFLILHKDVIAFQNIFLRVFWFCEGEQFQLNIVSDDST